jgi:hypothetical protein
MAPLIALFVWACAVNALCRSGTPWRRNLGGALTFAGSLVCFAALFHII